MKTKEIRRKFIEYFKNQGHAVIPSSPVFPHDDPTLLFTNAGMNQFKDVFLGLTQRDYQRATTAQKCVRVGGKHNDLDNVGHTDRHLTFFEMLGNFSFGNYFKKEAIAFAWEVATSIFKFEPEKIWPTVYKDDQEAFDLWKNYVPEHKITRFGEKDNFWAMGDTGPCGPCTELFYDRGVEFGKANCPAEDIEGNRFLEFWNLVFMQFNRKEDGTLEPLPKPSVDTGAGIERIMSLITNVESVFETDVLRALIAKIEEISGIKYSLEDRERFPAFRVIADHLRTLSFAIADGVQPSNLDRGYVLRKILRRAVRYGKMLGFNEPFLAQLLPTLIHEMGDDYPELTKSHSRIVEILTIEEESFFRTLNRGGNLLNQIISHAKTGNQMISGDEAFKLKDTYGFPLEEIILLAKDAGLEVDLTRYQLLEDEAKERSRKAQKLIRQTVDDNIFANFLENSAPTIFCGYEQIQCEAEVKGIVLENSFADSIQEGQEGMIFLDKTPFYAEMGGQVGDTGMLAADTTTFEVNNAIAPYKGLIGHVGKVLKGEIKVGDKIKATINLERRNKIERNHTATHLLHWALHKVLGEHIKQAGSVVDDQRLRFDFSHHKSLTKEEIRQIEDLINSKIRENKKVSYYELKYEEVQKREDIKQFFGDKYGNEVRVIDIDFSKELCGGTHVDAIGKIGHFHIAKESSIAAGIRRIEAVTGEAAESIFRENEDLLNSIALLLKSQPQRIKESIDKLIEENRTLIDELKIIKKIEAEREVQSLLSKVDLIHGISFLGAEVKLPSKELKSFADTLMNSLKDGIIILFSIQDEKCNVVVKVGSDAQAKKISAVELLRLINPIIEGSGGGKADFAQGGGKLTHKTNEALQAIKAYLLSLDSY